jgi:hypothetical protein
MEAKDQGLEIELYVYRRLDNRLENLPDDSPRAYELHLLREKALHEALGGVEGLSIDWFQADDTTSHELAELWLSFAPHIHTAVVAGMTLFAGELAKAAIGEFAKKAASIVIDPLIHKQKEGKILNFMLRIPGGFMISVSRESEVYVQKDNGWPESQLKKRAKTKNR